MEDDSKEEDIVPHWLWPLPKKPTLALMQFRKKKRSSSSEVEIVHPPERVGKVKIELVKRSNEEGIEDLISFNNEDLLQPRLDRFPEIDSTSANGISEERMESYGGQACTNPVNKTTELSFPKLFSVHPSLEPFSSNST